MKITPQAIAGALLAMHATAFAYNEDGHFYTVVALEQERRDLANLPADHFRIVALCAQIPDLSRELDAVTLKVNSLGALGGWLWGGFGACRNDEVRHMVSVHHYVHALTDGDAKRTEAAANETVTKLRAIWSSDPTYVNACALGLGLHLLGDSQSHRRLGTDSQMYGPGMGHANDNHDPDYIVFRDRLPLWKRYVGTLGNIHLIQEEKVHRGEMFKIFDTRLTGGSRENSYFTPTIIEEMKRLQTPTGGPALSPFERARHDG